MKITKLEPQKKHAGRYNLEVDEEFCCGLDEKLITELDLYTGKEVNENDLGQIREAEDYHKCLNKAFSLISIRMNAEKELRKKLIKKYSAKSVNKVIDRLKELNYVNDETFMKSWVSSREGSRGQFLLKRELFQKGIDKDLIENFFDGRNGQNEIENARRAVAKKRWPEMTREEKYQKIGGYLSRRGFNYDIIKQIISEM